MAPDITEKKTKNCSKKYAYSAHSKYSKWEKDRRDRFNSKLEDLARCLPSYTKDNSWKKVEIIENAILSITSRSVNQSNVTEETVRKLSNEVNNLKNIILQFTGFNESSEDIYRLTSHQISSILSEILMREKEREEAATVLPVQVVTSPDKTEKNLAFVAKIAQSNDHCYSMNVSEEISGEVEVVESEVVGGAGGPQLAKVVGIVDTVESGDNNSQAGDETILTLVQDGSVVELPQLISFEEPPQPPGSISGNVRTIFVNEAPRPSLLFQPPPPPPPLPIPVISEVVNNGRLVSKIAIPRLRLEKRKKKVRKTYTRTKPFISKSCKKDKIMFAKDNPEVSDDPLINKEEIEILEETLKEDAEKTEKAALGKDKNVSLTGGGGGGGTTKRKLESLSKKKSKSSYSIAALCQISVNIGDRPEIANSPGVMSLNSVGTISPANTPGPPSDTEKTFTLEPGCNIVIGTEPEETVIEELKTIIRPEDVSLLQQIEVTTTSQPSVTNISPSSQSYLSSFPLVNKQQQQQLACDKINQRDIYQALKDLDDIKELQGIEREKSQPRQEKPPARAEKKAAAGKGPGKEMVKPDCPQDQSKLSGAKQVVGQLGSTNPVMATKTSTSALTTKSTTTKVSAASTKTSALSVYDFSSSKPETPPLPLQESRKDSKSSVKPGVMNQSSCKASYPGVPGPVVSPDKKSYTELQSKTKKATEETVKKYASDHRKSLPDQTGAVIGQQMSGGGGGTGGYLQTNEMMYSETVRPHQHHQDPSMVHRQRSSYNSGYPGPGSTRQYSTSSSSSSSTSSHYPYQAVQHHSNLQPYHHPYNHPDVQHSSAKYSCSAAPHSSHSYIHSDFHSRNYYSPTKNYPGGSSSTSSASNVSSYRNFNTNEICPVIPPEPFNYKRTSVVATNQQMTEVTQQIPAGGDKTGPTTSSGTFSVTHLVNSNQRKGSKRTSTGSSKAAKQPRTEAAKESKSEKEEGKRTGRTGTSRRNKSGSRSNYSAESLISSSGASTQTMATTASPCKNQNTKVQQNSAIKSTSNWGNDINHFSGLQLSSLSPSPANLFPTDLSSIDFQMSLFPSDPTSLSSSLPTTLQTPPVQNVKTSSKQPAACQVGTNQRSSTAVPDWTLNTGILDSGFLPPIPTLTPPSDPMTDPMSGYTFMSPMSHSHSAGFYPTCAQSGTRNQSYSAHSAANISVSGYSTGSKTTNAGHNSFPPSQMVSLPPSQTGSLVNFNLSTIFPEINIAPGSQNSLMVPPSLVFSNNPADQQQ